MESMWRAELPNPNPRRRRIKNLRKDIEGFQRQIAKHRHYIATEGAPPETVQYWQDEIAQFQLEIRKRKAMLAKLIRKRHSPLVRGK